MTSPQVISFMEGNADRSREYYSVSLYLPDVRLHRRPEPDVRALLDEFFRFQAHPYQRSATHFDDAGLLASAFVRWYYALEGMEVAVKPYNGDWDWLVWCEWNEDVPLVTQAEKVAT